MFIHEPYPGYENQYLSFANGKFFSEEELEAGRKAQFEAMTSYEVPEGMTIEDKIIDGPDEGQKLTIRIYKPAGLPEKAPVVMDIHGGGWVGGSLDIDNARCIAIAVRVPCIVVGVDYRLSGTPEVGFPMPLMDCVTAYRWILNHQEELGGNGMIGTHGSSAGANLVGGLSLYLRDHGEQQPALAVMNCPPTSLGFTADPAYTQNFELRMGGGPKHQAAEVQYLNGFDGTPMPNYYAFPYYCPDLEGLKPHFILAAEYDTLRDDGLKYARRLLDTGITTDVFVGAKCCHCWTAAPGVMTDMTHDVIALAYKREFGMLDHLKKY